MISAAQTLSMMTSTSKAIDIAIRASTAMQKETSNIIEFTASKIHIFYNVKRDSVNDITRSVNNDDKNNDNSESNRDDDDEIE